jgi:hypothetical protein
VLGGLGGLLGWALLGLIVEPQQAYLRAALQGGLAGALIGGLVGCVEGALNVNRRQLLRGLLNGLIMGAVGGALGLVGGEVALQLSGGGLVARALGWGIFGMAIGLGEGYVSGSRRRATYGAIGGAGGGIVGGLLFEVLAQQSLESESVTRGVGLVLLGACVGSLFGVVTEAFVRSRLRVISGAREGREYDLEREETTVGSSDSCDVYLPGDPQLQLKHASIRFARNRLTLQRCVPAAVVKINGVLAGGGSTTIRDGDRLELGQTKLVIRAKATDGVTAP